MNGWRRVVLLVGTAVAARLAYLFLATDLDAAVSDAGQYHELATNLAAGRGFSHNFPQLTLHATAFRPPAYPFLLSILYRVTGPSVIAGKLLNVVLGVVVVLLADRLASRIAGSSAGLAAGLLVAVFPPIIANDVTLLAEPLSLVLLLAVLLALQAQRWIPAACATGALVLTKPSAQFLVVLVAGWVVWRLGWRRAVGFVAVAVVIVVPWMVRNHSEVGTWSLVTSNGFNLAAVYSAPAQDRHTFVDPVQDPAFDDLRLDQFDEATWTDKLTARGLDGIRAHPTYVAEHVARNGLATFELRPSYNDPAEELDGRNHDVRVVALPLFYAVVVAGGIGLWRFRRDPIVVLLAGLAAYFLLANLVFVAPPRLRSPIDLALCVGAGLLIGSTFDARRGARLGGSGAGVEGIDVERDGVVQPAEVVGAGDVDRTE